MEDIASLRRECEENPKHLPSRLELGDLLMEQGDFAAALEVYSEAVELKPTYTKAVKKKESAEKMCSDVNWLRDRGNELFNKRRYESAWQMYDRAIELLKARGERDAKLHTNRAACLLTEERWVAASFDGVMSIQIDPEWWKGYWYHGQGLLGQVRGKGPSKISQLKAEQALKSLERASQCKGFPEDKRARVEQLQARARHVVFYLAQNVQCPQS